MGFFLNRFKINKLPLLNSKAKMSKVRKTETFYNLRLEWKSGQVFIRVSKFVGENEKQMEVLVYDLQA